MNTTILGLLKYSDAFGIPRHVSKPFIIDMINWSEKSGQEWTVSRIKAIKLDFIRIKAGLEPCSSFIKRNGFHFGGSIGGIQTWCSQSRKRWSKTIRLLQAYTSFISPDVTPLQEQKFLEGVTASPIEIPSSWRELINRAFLELGIHRVKLSNPKSLVFYPTSSTKRVPFLDGTSGKEEDYLISQSSFLFDCHLGNQLLKKYRDLFSSAVKGIITHDGPGKWCADSNLRPSIPYGNVGKIGLIQEPGYKLRAVANPSRVYQAVLRPLGDCLYDTLRDLPWDCTHNQMKPKEALLERLGNHLPVYSVDLSGATDYFPLDFQLMVLNRLVINGEHVDLFKDLSRSPWHYRGGTIRWTKGQPLGLYPSFASFALAHGLLLFILNNFQHKNAFFVLGDDVVILDEALNNLYRQTLSDWDCPISDAKSISSNSLCEFGGKIFTDNGVTHQFKWRPITDDSFLDFVRNTGPRAISLLKPMQRNIAKVLWEVPDFLGGLGFNPKGKTLETRVYEFLSKFPSEENLTFVMSYNRKINHWNHFHYVDQSSLHNLVVSESDFDKKSIAFIAKYLPHFVGWYEAMGKNLHSVANDISLPLDVRPSWKTLVEKLYKRLSL